MDEIKNKIKDSGLIQLDLADFKPRSILLGLDLAAHLWQGLVLKEKDFRFWIKNADWESYRGQSVYIYCSADAIIPMWANMLIVSALNPFAKGVYFGNENKVREQQLLENINTLNINEYNDQRVVIKGCGDTPIGESAYIAITQKLRPVVKSIMYGEPCSTVPVYKKK